MAPAAARPPFASPARDGLTAVLSAGHAVPPSAADPPPRWQTPATILTAAGLTTAALAGGAALTFLGETAATLAAAALTLVLGALWVRAAAQAGARTAVRATAPAVAGVALAGAAAATAAAPSSAAAQRAEQRGISLAVGADARGGATGEGAGRALLLGVSVWRGPASLPATVRLTGTFLDRVGRGDAPTTFGGVGIDGSVPLYDAGPVRPYLVAGVGAYHLRGWAAEGQAFRPARTTAALTGGAGVRVPVGAAAAFVEARYTTFRGVAGGGYTPVVAGLQF